MSMVTEGFIANAIINTSIELREHKLINLIEGINTNLKMNNKLFHNIKDLCCILFIFLLLNIFNIPMIICLITSIICVLYIIIKDIYIDHLILYNTLLLFKLTSLVRFKSIHYSNNENEIARILVYLNRVIYYVGCKYINDYYRCSWKRFKYILFFNKYKFYKVKK